MPKIAAFTGDQVKDLSGLCNAVDETLKQYPRLEERMPKSLVLAVLMVKIDQCSNADGLLDLYEQYKAGNLNQHRSIMSWGDANTWQLAIICFRKKQSELTQIEASKNDPLFEELSKKSLPEGESVVIKMFNKLANETHETAGRVLSTFHQLPQNRIFSKLKEKIFDDYQKLRQAESVQSARPYRAT